MKPSLSAPHLHSYPQPRKQAGQRAEATAAAWKPVPSHPPEAAHRAVFRRGCTVRTQARRSTLIAGRRSILSGDPHVKQAKQTEEGRGRAHCLKNEGSLARETLLVTKEAPRRRQCTGGRPLDAHIFQCCVPACTASAGLVRSPENFCAHSPGRPRRQVWRSRRGPPNKYNTALARWWRASTPQLHHGSGAERACRGGWGAVRGRDEAAGAPDTSLPRQLLPLG